MDFFEHQDQARRATRRLVWLFAVGVIAIIASTYALVVVIFNAGEGKIAEATGDPTLAIGWWEPTIFGVTVAAVLAVVGFGSLYKVSQLSGGGHVVAEHLGGRRLSTDTTDPTERKVLNVVEEMAIASGTPVPPVFFMDNEPGINAFAAGYAPEDAVIGITRGCAERLSRDQLQGVVAHEFSHVLNGDMRLNIRLIGIVHGILVIGLIGYYIMRVAFYSGAARGRSNKDNNPLPLLALGVGLIVIGFMGTLFGSLIKAAVSRQREFLADASAVQFTRNPDGIAGALKVIGGFEKGSQLDNPNAPEASHMFFSMGVSGIQEMFATHPPLDERISRIDRTWEYVKQDKAAAASPGVGSAVGGAAMGFAGQATEAPAPPSPPVQRSEPAGSSASASSAVDSIGRPTEQHVAYARQVVAAIPPVLTDMAHEPYGARAVVYAMLLDRDEPDVRKKQLDRLAVKSDSGVFHATRQAYEALPELDKAARLPLIDMAIPALRALSARQYEIFRNNVVELVRADEKIDLFEWVIQKIVLRHLEPHFSDARPPRPKYHQLNAVRDSATVLLSALAYVGARSEDAARAAFDAGARGTELGGLALLPMADARLGSLEKALKDLNRLTPKPKRLLIRAAAGVVAADRQITTGEAELLRAVADTLDCPMPPLLPGQPVV